ncbi:helix-turn-helix domain-containing protein [Paracoccus fontiphilus]|uniref:Helix-turn-helix domain-containing protein n=1 Tax=Paracoccus fontiphilus TaxID=1815556 RepID=A0ABV7IDA8_9RHOB|nr:helix-turn-helix domain-containing protein [Paracoccus fontiphilus]
MASHYQHLSFEERRKIAQWREGKMPVPEIADRLSRPASTVNGGAKSGHAAG